MVRLEGDVYKRQGIDEEPKKGWTWHAIVYDLDHLDKKPEKVDLYQVVKNYDKNFYLKNQGTIIIEEDVYKRQDRKRWLLKHEGITWKEK